MTSWARRRISERWDLDFWQLLTDIQDQGFNRASAAKIIGVLPKTLSAILQANRDRNPWGSASVVANYVADSGEGFREAVTRMQAEGFSVVQVSRAIGFSGRTCTSALRYALRVRGIGIEFAPGKVGRPARAKKPFRAPLGPNVTDGWPTWKRVDEICRQPIAP